MTVLATQLRAVALFYRSVVPFMAGVSVLILLAVLLPALREGWGRSLLPALLLVKLATAPVVWYLSEQLRPGQYWFYFNLNISRRRLWAGVVALDGLLFLGGALLMRAVLS
ncbi:hypothetical protein KB206_18690 [Microvirga sp. STS02]|uniref:hypothetical protein n=1 Tax=Hymenobacter negativus TaxID=2795026 RepID=UPI0018DC3049|nr:MULTISPECIES: hypothetical protein [Bacteria]MBH8570926.1 hypothetical protein [Hymenobacter negativus]MBR7210664.1 hypothetical protein [Microvirga sp. STS02]